MVIVNNDNYDELVAKSDVPVVLDFGATWCGPCKKLEPVIEELAGEMEGKVFVGKVDVEKARDVAAKFGVMSVPTVIFLKGGEPVHQFVGVESKEKITGMISQHFGVGV